MNLLFDTHAFIWWDSEPAKLSARVLTLCHDTTNVLFLSVASVWEMQIDQTTTGQTDIELAIGGDYREPAEEKWN